MLDEILGLSSVKSETEVRELIAALREMPDEPINFALLADKLDEIRKNK